MKNEYTEETALATSSKFYNYDNFLGYFPFRAANFLVGTGKYQFESVSSWGYILKRK